MGRLRSLAPLSPPPRGAVGERNAARFFAASVAPSRGVWGTKLCPFFAASGMLPDYKNCDNTSELAFFSIKSGPVSQLVKSGE